MRKYIALLIKFNQKFILLPQYNGLMGWINSCKCVIVLIVGTFDEERRVKAPCWCGQRFHAAHPEDQAVGITFICTLAGLVLP